MLAIIRIRGKVGVEEEIEDTLKILRLKTVNNCVIVPETPAYKGMIKKVRNFVAYGNIDFDTFLTMLKKRGRLTGNKRLTKENVKELGFNTIEEMAEVIFEGKIKIKDIRKLQPVFRLTPPKKGHKSIKEHYPKGSLGYWGDKINSLLRRMI
ncbi:MAG: 50S ribosomal protein L30 [Candidatus Aenigmarchaeota archaeon]|nr:50S ribosomal protein L30 [Candidatus Aenigmarchaeota archaeon]